MGSVYSVVRNFVMASRQTFPPLGKPQWSWDQMPDLTGKVAIVTGANSGIGKEIAKALLTRNATVYILTRNAQRAQAAIDELREKTGKEARFIELDLADLTKVKKAAEEFLSKEKELHLLFNNGGVLTPPMTELTAQGFEMQFGVNVLGHFYLTKLLLPTLLSTAKSSAPGTVRVIHTASVTHWFKGLDFATFKDGPKRRGAINFLLYCASKTGNIVFAKELARRYGDQGIVSVAAHPGNLSSDIVRNMNWAQKLILSTIFYNDLSLGAMTLCKAGTAPDTVDWNGKYATCWGRLGKCRPDTDDPKLGKDFWEYMEDQVKDI